MRTGGAVLLMQRVEGAVGEAVGEADERRPHSTVEQGDLASHEARGNDR